MATTDVPAPSHAHNMRLIGHTDQNGRGDGQQIMVQNGHAYIGHVCSRGFSVVDVRDPTRPKTVNYIENPPNTWSLHLQVHDDLLLLVHGRDMFSQPEMADERNYYKPKAGRHDDHATPQTRNWSAGMAVRHLRAGRATSDRLHAGRGHRAAPHLVRRRPLGLCLGHDGGLLDYILVTIDMADPTKPAIVGRYWLPGMNLAAGEVANWPLPTGRYGLHHAVVQDDVAYCAWRDACLVVVDVKDRSDPKLVVHKNWAPPFGGGTHNCLPLPERNLSSCSTRRCSTRSRTASSRSGCSTTR